MGMEENRTFRIANQYMAYLTEKLDKMNRKAIKFGCSPIKLTEVSTEDVDDEETGAVTRYHIVTVEGETPVLAGWSFVATIQNVNEAGIIIRAIPGKIVPEQYRNASQTCDHCGHNRRRNQTYLVQNVKTGEYRQVGSTCLQDFLGGEDPRNIAAYAEMLADIEEELGNTEKMESECGRNFFLLDVYLSWVCKVIEEEGWLSRGKARDEMRTSTADRALNDMFPFGKYRPEKPTQRHVEQAETALKWAEENLHGKDNLNDYLHNMKIVTSTRAIRFNMAGLAASLIPLWKRETTPKTGENSQFIGKVGDKIQLTATCLGVTPIDSFYGVTYLFRFVTEDGNVITTFTKSLGISQGDKVEIRAKVKDHKEYKGIKQTEVNYLKVLAMVEGE